MKNLNTEDFRELFAMIIYISGIGYAWAVTFFPVESQHNADVTLGFLMGSALTMVLTHIFKAPQTPQEGEGDEV